MNEPRRWLWSCTISKIKTRPFDPANDLQDEADVTAYPQAAIDDGSPAWLAAAFGDIAEARGMYQLARGPGLSRKSLYKSLSSERAPSSDTMFKVIHAMGFKIHLTPLYAGG